MKSYRQLIQELDRTQSMALVEKIASDASIAKSELDVICDALAKLDDPRVEYPLISLAEDTHLPEQIRMNSVKALCNLRNSTTAEQRQQWWRSTDEVIKSLAIATADGTELELVKSIAADPGHKQYLQALEAFSYCDNASMQNQLIDALSDSNPDAQAIAASAMVHFTPCRAEKQLLLIARTSDSRLVKKALDTLVWYTSQNVLSELYCLAASGPIDHREWYRNVLRLVAEEINDTSQGHAKNQQAHVDRWLEPVKAILKEQLNSSTKSIQVAEQAAEQRENMRDAEENGFGALSLDQLIDELANPDGPWEHKRNAFLRQIPGAYSGDRIAMAQTLTTHPDSFVRAHSASWLRQWDMQTALIDLLDDRDNYVAGAAASQLKLVDKDHTLAAKLLHLFNRPTSLGTLGAQALEAYLVHAPEAGINQFILDLIEQDDREAVINCCLDNLSSRNQTQVLASLSWLLERDPLVTWGVHSNYIANCISQNIKNLAIAHLSEVDDLDLQITMAGYLANE